MMRRFVLNEITAFAATTHTIKQMAIDDVMTTVMDEHDNEDDSNCSTSSITFLVIIKEEVEDQEYECGSSNNSYIVFYSYFSYIIYYLVCQLTVDKGIHRWKLLRQNEEHSNRYTPLVNILSRHHQRSKI